MAGEETVSVRINLRDAITAGLIEIEHQAKETRDALSDMEDRKLQDNFDRTTKKVELQEKGLRKLRLKALDLKFAFSALKIPAIAVAITQLTAAVSSLTAGLGAMIASLAPAVGLMGAAPAGILALVSSMVTAKLAFGGVSDAISTMMKEGATVEEVNEALKGLSKPAQAFAKQVAGMKPHIKGLRESVQAAMLPKLGDALRRTVPLFDDLKATLAPLGATLGQVADNAATMVASGPFRADFKTIMGENNRLVETGGKVLLNLLDVLRNVMVSAAPMVRKLSDALLGWSQRMKDAAQRGRDLGTLRQFFLDAYATAARLGRTLKNFAMGLFNIFRLGRGLGDDLNNSLESLSIRFRAWTESASGQKKINKWFEDARPVLHELALLVRDVWRAFVQFDQAGRKSGAGITETIRALRTQLLPALTKLITGVGGQLGPALVDIATALVKFLDFASFSPLVTFVQAIGGLANFFLSLAGSSNQAHAAATAFVTMGLAVKSGTTIFSLGSKGVEWYKKKVQEAKDMATAMGNAVNKVSGWVRGFGGPGGTLDGAKLRLMYAKDAMVKFWRETVVANAKLAVQKTRLLAVKAVDFIRFLGDLALAYVKLAVQQARVAAAWLLERARIIAVAVAQGVVRTATLAWAAAQWVLNAAMMANPITLIILGVVALVAAVVLAYHKFDWFRAAIDKVWQGIQWLWDLMLRFKWFLLAVLFPAFAPILVIAANWDKVRAAVGFVIDKVKDLIGWFGRAGKAAGDMLNKIPGAGLVKKGLGLIFGDTSAPRARSGNLAHTFASHGAISASTPGKQYVTNVSYGAYKGSDHVAGRALDLVGAGLNTYAKQVRAMGGYAAMHGSGPSRHLHAVYGDTARPRARVSAAAAPEQLVMNGPLIGEVHATSDVDVEVAVSRALNKWVRDRNERR